MYKKIKKVVAIHDMSGFGRCSLTAAIPILSVLKTQPIPFPTAILSCQTGYNNYTFLDLTQEMKLYKNIINNMNEDLHTIYSGFLGSENQVDIVKEFILENPKSLVIIDPVMGDNGELYKTYKSNMVSKMKDLIKHADIITPNLTEACLLLERDFLNFNSTEENLFKLSKELSNLGPKKIIITGIIKENIIINFAYDKDKEDYFVTENIYDNKSYSGTGDIFSSIICGLLTNDYELEFSLKIATDFIFKVIKNNSCYDKIDNKNGIIFEPFLIDLII